MILMVEGDILNAKEKTIVQQCNAQGVMGSGLAKQIRDKYPIVYKEYKKLCDYYTMNHVSLLGLCQVIKVNNDRFVANIIGQEYYGRDGKRYTNYNALIRGFTRLFLNTNHDIAISYLIGCGLGGGDWNKIMNILTILSEDFPYNIVIYRQPS